MYVWIHNYSVLHMHASLGFLTFLRGAARLVVFHIDIIYVCTQYVHK